MDNLERIIWIYWNSGWENAPEISVKCHESWVYNNPGWTIKTLDQDTLKNYLDLEKECPWIYSKDINFTAQSDIIRILLLEKYGGVWADSTLFCRRPLDSWYDLLNKNDFFAFSKPSPDKLISSWFLAAKTNSYIIQKWREHVFNYWNKRTSADNYFWFHFLFNKLYSVDQKFKKIWDSSVKVSALAPHYFIPYENSFFQRVDNEKINSINEIQTPVLKLTYKYDLLQNRKDTVLYHILNDNLKMSNMKLIIAWHESFLQNETADDYLSVDNLMNFLKEKGIAFDYGSYKNFDHLKDNPADLNSFIPENYNVLIFCCGPIDENHIKLLTMFSHAHKIGLGISLSKKPHFNYLNSFDYYLGTEKSNPFEWIINNVFPGKLRKNILTKAKLKAEVRVRSTLDQLYAHLISFKFPAKERTTRITRF